MKPPICCINKLSLPHTALSDTAKDMSYNNPLPAHNTHNTHELEHIRTLAMELAKRVDNLSHPSARRASRGRFAPPEYEHHIPLDIRSSARFQSPEWNSDDRTSASTDDRFRDTTERQTDAVSRRRGIPEITEVMPPTSRVVFGGPMPDDTVKASVQNTVVPKLSQNKTSTARRPPSFERTNPQKRTPDRPSTEPEPPVARDMREGFDRKPREFGMRRFAPYGSSSSSSRQRPANAKKLHVRFQSTRFDDRTYDRESETTSNGEDDTIDDSESFVSSDSDDLRGPVHALMNTRTDFVNDLRSRPFGTA